MRRWAILFAGLAACGEPDQSAAPLGGVRTEPVVTADWVRTARVVGEVEVGEGEASVVNLRFSGWADSVLVGRIGEEVERGDVLFEVYSPDLVAAQEELLAAVHGSGPDSVAATQAGRRLEQLGVSGRDIQSVIDAGAARRTVPVRAPQGGFVLHLDVVPGGRVEEGRDLYRIGNLTKIWVTAPIPEYEAPLVEVGRPAVMTLPVRPNAPIEGRVAYLPPTIDPARRTLAVRLEFDNPGIPLRPGMLADVAVELARRPGALTVPADAVVAVDGGSEVVVLGADDRAAARRVTVGPVGDGGRVEVLTGLTAGEEVVVRGRSRLQVEPAAPALPAAPDPAAAAPPAEDAGGGG
jgi:Cu(I)/Ag(I) efflux system membrane fusion protein